MTTITRLYNYEFKSIKTYLFSMLFIAGNIVMPQLAHMYPNGGPMFLPIYFFTLIAAYKYGIKVGLLTALLSPLLNSFIFGMPAPALLPVIIIKSTLLATAAGFIAHKTGKINLIGLIIAVVFYQFVGSIAEWLISGSFTAALQDIKLGYPGIIIQIFGGYLFLKLISKY